MQESLEVLLGDSQVAEPCDAVFLCRRARLFTSEQLVQPAAVENAWRHAVPNTFLDVQQVWATDLSCETNDK